MWNINRETLRQDIVLITCQTQVRDPLHLILTVVDKALVKMREFWRKLNKDVRLLNIVFHARNRRHIHVRSKRIPFVKMIGLFDQLEGKVHEFLRRHGSDCSGLLSHTGEHPSCNWGDDL